MGRHCVCKLLFLYIFILLLLLLHFGCCVYSILSRFLFFRFRLLLMAFANNGNDVDVPDNLKGCVLLRDIVISPSVIYDF